MTTESPQHPECVDTLALYTLQANITNSSDAAPSNVSVPIPCNSEIDMLLAVFV